MTSKNAFSEGFKPLKRVLTLTWSCVLGSPPISLRLVINSYISWVGSFRLSSRTATVDEGPQLMGEIQRRRRRAAYERHSHVVAMRQVASHIGRSTVT